jgi:hypothetical protein
MKKLVCMLSLVSALVSCNGNTNRSNGSVYVADYSPSQSSVTVTPEVENLGQGLDLQMLGEMVKSSTSAQDVEDKLNSNGSINNLDLDNDGNVDYVKVTEYGSGSSRGLSFTVDLAGGQTQEIATIQIDNSSNNFANMNIQGNSNLYGNSGYYTSRYSVGDILLMHYLFAPHRYYVSPYRYGYYPRAYHPYHSVPMHSYRSRVVTSTRTTRIIKTTRPSSTVSRISSPNANKYSSSVRSRATSMARPTSSQRSFTTTTNSRPSTGGFGSSSSARRSSSSSSSYSSSPSRSSSSSYSSSPSRSSSRSSSSFGSSSRSSFGGGSRSSSRRR